MIRDYFGLKEVKDISNEQAYVWLKANAATFDKSFALVVEEYPSFWDDAENNLDGALEIVKHRFIDQEKEK